MTSQPNLSPSPQTAVLDSGCTSTLVTPSTKCNNKHPTKNGLRVGIPNGSVMKGSHDAQLDLDHFPIQLSRRPATLPSSPTCKKP